MSFKTLGFLGVLANLGMVGCATVTTGTSQTITIDTVPSGAVCRMMREDHVVGVVNPTPGSVAVSKDKDTIAVSCEKDEYLTADEELDAEFQGATLGNVLLGGVIGVVVDASSGAANKYPDSITIALTPARFETEELRDAYFEGRRAEVDANFEKLVQERAYSCKTERCRRKRRQLEQERDAAIVRLDEVKNSTQLAGEQQP